MSKILIIEDDPFLLKLYDEILKSAGYEVDIAEDGDTGKKKIKSSRPDLVLLDIMLPKINGLDLLEEVRSKADTKDIKVIIVTNLASEEDHARAEKLGVSKYMIKTEYDPNQIVDAIKEIVSP